MTWQEEIQAIVAAYNASDSGYSFSEYAERYLQEHPSQYDFSTAMKYVVIEPKQKAPEPPMTDEHIRQIVREELERWEKQLEMRIRMNARPVI